jgi:hypothetical protein
LKEIEGFATTNLAQDDSVGAMTEGCQAVLFSAGFEPKNIFFLNLCLCCVFDQNDTLITWNEFR